MKSVGGVRGSHQQVCRCFLLPCQRLWLSMQLRVFIWVVSFLLSAEGEAESQWLQDTGLSDLLGGLGLDGHHQGLLSTLTQTQVAAVCRRLDICTYSARRRHRAPVRDVRDIFGGFGSGVSQWHKGDYRAPGSASTSCVKQRFCCKAVLACAHVSCAPCCMQVCLLCAPACVCLCVLGWVRGLRFSLCITIISTMRMLIAVLHISC